MGNSNNKLGAVCVSRFVLLAGDRIIKPKGQANSQKTCTSIPTPGTPTKVYKTEKQKRRNQDQSSPKIPSDL
eukprot:3268755-Amphidinium_carterae.1